MAGIDEIKRLKGLCEEYGLEGREILAGRTDEELAGIFNGTLPDAVTAAQAGDAIIAPQAERTRVPSGGCGSSISGGNEILNYWYKYLMEFLTP